MKQPFNDIVERPDIELSGRFREPEVDPGRSLTAEQIAAIQSKLAPPPSGHQFRAATQIRQDYDVKRTQNGK